MHSRAHGTSHGTSASNIGAGVPCVSTRGSYSSVYTHQNLSELSSNRVKAQIINNSRALDPPIQALDLRPRLTLDPRSSVLDVRWHMTLGPRPPSQTPCTSKSKSKLKFIFFFKRQTPKNKKSKAKAVPGVYETKEIHHQLAMQHAT